jgi:hypothetical protein
MKKGLLSALALAAVVTGLMVAAVSASSAGTPAFEHYVACGLSRKAKPANVCPVKSKKGAFFKSLKGEVKYTVCVKFPKQEHLCTEKPQVAEEGTLYVNKITSTSVGKHEVSWFVKGKKVGTTVFRVK